MSGSPAPAAGAKLRPPSALPNNPLPSPSTVLVTSLAAGASGNYGLGALNKVIIDLDGGHVLVSAIGSGAVLGVVTDKEAKLGNIAYEMTVFANRAGGALSPQLVLGLKNSVGAASAR